MLICIIPVNRKDVSGSDVIESRVMNFCKELFPVVQYLYIPAFNHPSSLVRCLICSLNPVSSFFNSVFILAIILLF